MAQAGNVRGNSLDTAKLGSLGRDHDWALLDPSKKKEEQLRQKRVERHKYLLREQFLVVLDDIEREGLTVLDDSEQVEVGLLRVDVERVHGRVLQASEQGGSPIANSGGRYAKRFFALRSMRCT